MARRLLIIGAVLAAFVIGGAALIRFAGAGATEFAVNGTELRMSGVVTGAATDRFERLMEQHPELETLVLGDMPGTDDVSWLIGIGFLIGQAGLATEAEGKLYNDAILLFLAGAERTITEGSLTLVSPQAARARGWPYDESTVANAERRSFLRAALGSDALADFAQEAYASHELYTLTAEDIGQFGLIPATTGD